MSEENKIGTYQFVAEPFHVDFNGRLTMGVLGNHLLNCAGFHASDRGFGIATLNEDNYTWVLSRLAVELDEMPYQYENFSVQTWVENVYRLFTDRNFAIINKDGKKIGYARSVWAMISLNTRKPADLLTLHGGSIVDYVCDEPCPIEKPSRIKVTSDRPVATLTAKYSDIDINGHVNIECTCHRPSYIFCTANLITPFSDRLGDTYQVDFLKSVCSEKTRPYLSGNNYDRCTVYHCIGNTGDCIRCSGTACHQTNTYLTRYAGKTLRCMSSSLFVANQDMVQCILMIVQSIEYRHDRTSGITEDSSHSLMFQGTHQCFRTCY